MISGVLEDNKYNYEFHYEEKDVLDFKEKLINNASKIEHVDFIGPYGQAYRKINYEADKVKNLEIKDAGYDKYGVRLYHYTYSKYEYPYLVYLINNFLSGDMDSLFEIIYPDFDLEYIPVYDSIRNEIDALQYTNIKNTDDILSRTNRIRNSLYEIKEGNVFIPAAEYYSEFLVLINLKIKDKKTLELINKKEK